MGGGITASEGYDLVGFEQDLILAASAPEMAEALEKNLALVDWWLSTSWAEQRQTTDTRIAQAKEARNMAKALLARIRGDA